MNNFKIGLIIGFSLFFTSAVVARNDQKKIKIQKEKHIQRMDEHVSELMADRVNFKKDIFLKELQTIDDVMLEEELASEDDVPRRINLYGYFGKHNGKSNRNV
jgi:hypothetical protein